MIYLFWISLSLLFYTYFGYPLLLLILSTVRRPNRHLSDAETQTQPSLSIIIPVHNEEAIIEQKIGNTLSLNYPKERLDVILVSDGSTDRTEELIRNIRSDRITLLPLPSRRGKAAALNAGLRLSTADILVFSDASIMLHPDALQQIVRPFQSFDIACVSGEDHIPEGGGEGLYGKYELLLRNLESKVSSIVGASGCFYAQRRSLCQPFIEGMAPDFLSVLTTVQAGFRAITYPPAIGYMKSIPASRDEYTRKVRTFTRGIATLMHFRRFLNPIKYGFFSIELISHKIMRWLSGLFLIALLASNLFFLDLIAFRIFFILQIMFYSLSLVAYMNNKIADKSAVFRVPLYFSLVNIAALKAWVMYLKGMRQEIWEPSKR